MNLYTFTYKVDGENCEMDRFSEESVEGAIAAFVRDIRPCYFSPLLLQQVSQSEYKKDGANYKKLTCKTVWHGSRKSRQQDWR